MLALTLPLLGSSRSHLMHSSAVFCVIFCAVSYKITQFGVVIARQLLTLYPRSWTLTISVIDSSLYCTRINLHRNTQVRLQVAYALVQLGQGLTSDSRGSIQRIGLNQLLERYGFIGVFDKNGERCMSLPGCPSGFNSIMLRMRELRARARKLYAFAGCWPQQILPLHCL